LILELFIVHKLILEESIKKSINKKSIKLYTVHMIDNAEKFKSDREEIFGGNIEFMTYTKFIGKASTEKVANRGGIAFVINNVLHFEDFEKSGGLMVLFNQKENYEKTEFSFDLDQITLLKEVKEKNAAYCVIGVTEENEILPAPKGILGLFSKSVLQVMIEGQPSLFFDFLDKEGFMELVNKRMLESH